MFTCEFEPMNIKTLSNSIKTKNLKNINNFPSMPIVAANINNKNNNIKRH